MEVSIKGSRENSKRMPQVDGISWGERGGQVHHFQVRVQSLPKMGDSEGDTCRHIQKLPVE